MSNKVYVTNKLAKNEAAAAAAKALEEEGRSQLLWGVKKDRTKLKKESEPKKPEED